VALFIADEVRAQYHTKKLNRLAYPGERVTWEPCGVSGGHLIECSSVDVPMNHFDRADSGDKVFSLPLVRLRGHAAPPGRNILLNPGGPGVSGLEFVPRAGWFLNNIVGEGYHLVSFDPRGVNGSRPLASCFPDEETRLRLGAFRKWDPLDDSREMYAWTAGWTQSCADTMGVYAPNLNTAQIAADMNTILEALGQEHMYYWGFSWGTVLGQVYATLWPERAHRIILDGVVNLYGHFTEQMSRELYTDSENAFAGFVEECIKAKHNCALYKLADTKDALLEKLYAWRVELDDKPVSVYVDNKTFGILDGRTIWVNAIYPALYKPSKWYETAEILYELYHGNATRAFLSYGLQDFFSPPGDPYELISINDGLSGAEEWPQERDFIYDELTKFLNFSTFAIMESDIFYLKQQWRIPNTHHFKPLNRVETKNPLLILSTTYDPVTPLKSARVAREIFAGSRIVDVAGYGHASIAVPSKCIASHVRNFLADATLPENDTTCAVDEPFYYLPPEEVDSLISSYKVDGSDEAKLRLAQLQMAHQVELRFRP
jgi:pimeloyl-ACP methyl ester carboxylesterase